MQMQLGKISVRNLGLCLALAAGCAGPPEPSGLSDDPNAAAPLFWTTTSESGGVLHVLSTVPLGPPGGWRLADSILEAFAKSHVLVVEIDSRSISPQQMSWLRRDHGERTPGAPGDLELPAELRSTLDRQLEAFSIPSESFDSFRPWLMAVALDQIAALRQGYTPTRGVGHDFLMRADPLMEVIALETPERQLARFSELPGPLQLDMLQDALSRADEAPAHLDALVGAWRLGDLALLSRLTLERDRSSSQRRELYQRVYHSPGREISERLDTLLQSPRRFFAVLRVEHLLGGDGVIRGLEARGYRWKELLDRR